MQDFLVTEDKKPRIENGDFVVGNSDSQAVELLLISKQGEWKENPEAGCNIGTAVNGVIDRFLERNIRIQLEADNFKVDKLAINENGIELKGEYE